MKKFSQFYRDNSSKLFNYLLKKSGNEVLAADLMQESFVRYLERYKKKDESTALLFTIGRNLFNDYFRKKSSPSCSIILSEYVEEQSVHLTNVEQQYIARQDHKRLKRALDRLSDEERDILLLITNSDMRYREIAHIRGCSESSVKVVVHRARKKLKKIIKELENE